MGLTIFFIVIIIILLFIIISMKKEIRQIGIDISNSMGEYTNIHTKSIDKDVEFLVSQINFLYDENQKTNTKIKKADEELKRSIANMSHDLRTPLTSIMGYMQLIKDENIIHEEKMEYIEIVERRTKNLQNLISSFYDLSRLQSDEYKFTFSKVNLSTLLCENIATFYNEFINKNIEPIINIDENIPLIISDSMAVTRIFSNLISNMLKYGQNPMKISLKKYEKHIVSEFSNYAPNLTIDDVDKIFDRFFIGDKARSTNSSTGLGLSITKSFVKQLGHDIKAEIIQENLIVTILWKI